MGRRFLFCHIIGPRLPRQGFSLRFYPALPVSSARK